MITKEQMKWFLLGSTITMATLCREIDFQESVEKRAEIAAFFLKSLANNIIDLSTILGFSERFLEELLVHAPHEVKDLFKEDYI